MNIWFEGLKEEHIPPFCFCCFLSKELEEKLTADSLTFALRKKTFFLNKKKKKIVTKVTYFHVTSLCGALSFCPTFTNDATP